jgi:hypothetical protein
MAETDLKTVPGWTPRHLDKLAAAWIDSAEQVVAIAATPDGLRSLAEQLQVPEAEAQQLVDLARAALPSATRAELEAASDLDERGLGALGPDERLDDPPLAQGRGPR